MPATRSDTDNTSTITPSTSLSELPELLTPREFFAYNRIGKTSGYALLHSGKVRVVRLGRQIRVPRSELAKAV